MIETGTTCYLSGLIDLTTSLSKKINPSFINVTCFKKNKFKENFSKYYKIPINKIKLNKSNKNIDKLLKSWLGNNKVVTNLIDIINKELDIPINTYIPTKDSKLDSLLSGYNRGLSGMYFVEEIYFIEYNNYMICYILGNNE